MTQRVLIVDDNRDLAENIAEILESEGYVTIVASHPTEALDRAEDVDFGIAILDIRMPGMDGVSLFERLSALRPNATYILMTAFSTDQRIADALRAGVKTVLPKPVPVDELLALLPPPSTDVIDVLVVDDDAALSRALVEELQRKGYRPHAAGSHAEALDSLGSRPPQAAIVDVRLPDGDGAELAKSICREHGIPVVLITGFEVSDATRALGAQYPCVVLSKPFDPDELLETLVRVTPRSSPPSSS